MLPCAGKSFPPGSPGVQKRQCSEAGHPATQSVTGVKVRSEGGVSKPATRVRLHTGATVLHCG